MVRDDAGAGELCARAPGGRVRVRPRPRRGNRAQHERGVAGPEARAQGGAPARRAPAPVRVTEAPRSMCVAWRRRASPWRRRLTDDEGKRRRWVAWGEGGGRGGGGKVRGGGGGGGGRGSESGRASSTAEFFFLEAGSNLTPLPRSFPHSSRVELLRDGFFFTRDRTGGIRAVHARDHRGLQQRQRRRRRRHPRRERDRERP